MSFGSSKSKSPKLPPQITVEDRRQDKAKATERAAQDERMRLMRRRRFGRTVFTNPGLASTQPQAKAATLGGR